jgi:hypothetical protein
MQLFFNGKANGKVGVGTAVGQLLSDELAQGIDGTNGLVVIFHVSGSGGDLSIGEPYGWATYYATGDLTRNSNRAGYSPYNAVAGVTRIEALYSAEGWYSRIGFVSPDIQFDLGGYTVVTAIEPYAIGPTDGGTKTRIALMGEFTFSSCYIGPRAVSHPNGFEMASSFQVFFNGHHAGGTTVAYVPLVSDELDQVIDGANGIVVRFYVTGGLVWQTDPNYPIPGFKGYNRFGNSAAQLTASNNWDSDNTCYGVSQISAFYPAT